MNLNEQQLNNTKTNDVTGVEAEQTKTKNNALTQNNGLADLEASGEIKGGPTKRIWDYIRNNN